MADKPIVFYPHRNNKDGSFDSICLGCLLTIATAGTEADLVTFEDKHVCNQTISLQRVPFRIADVKIWLAVRSRRVTMSANYTPYPI
jgi:hypothetical protein